MSKKDESYHPDWTLRPTHNAVLRDMRAAAEQRQAKEEQAAAREQSLAEASKN